MAESYIQVAPDSTGKLVRNLELVTVDPTTGVQSTVECQVVVLMDPDGRLTSASTNRSEVLLAHVSEQLEELITIMRELGDLDTRQALTRKNGRNFSVANRNKKS